MPTKKPLLQQVLDLLLPRLCLVCDQDSAGDFLCAGCAETLPYLPAPSCPVCAHPHTAAENPEQPCGRCLSEPPYYDASLAIFAYAPPIDQLVQQMKYGRRLTAADFLAHSLLSAQRPPIDRLIPMPLSAQRLAERGFDQAVELARPLSRTLNVAMDLHSLSRQRHTTPQVELPWRERHNNMKGAFAAHQRFDGEHILVIDDVMTTGTTLNEVARVLKADGASRVTNLVVARTLRDHSLRDH